jgi:LacI family transcriptional regulator
MLFPDLTNPVYALIMRGAAQRANELGYAILLAELGDEDTASSYQRLVNEHRIDGLVISTARDSSGVVAELALEAPHVYVNRSASDEEGRSVTVDDEAAGGIAAEALLGAGHTNLAFLGDSDKTDTARRRRLGFMRACEAAGVPRPVDAVIPYTRAGGYQATAQLLSAERPPSGVFASSLLVGIGALAAAHQMGVSVPGDLSVVTLDAEDAEYTAPPMTAVRLPMREMGAAAVDMIDRVLNGETASDFVVPIAPRLIERASVAPPGPGQA